MSPVLAVRRKASGQKKFPQTSTPGPSPLTSRNSQQNTQIPVANCDDDSLRDFLSIGIDETPMVSQSCLRKLEGMFFPIGSVECVNSRSRQVSYLHECLNSQDIRVAGAAAMYIGKHCSPTKRWLKPLLERFLSARDLRPCASYLAAPLLLMSRRGELETGRVIHFLLKYVRYRHWRKDWRLASSDEQLLELVAAIVARIVDLGMARRVVSLARSIEHDSGFNTRDVRLFRRIFELSATASEDISSHFRKKVSSVERDSLCGYANSAVDLGLLSDENLQALIERLHDSPPRNTLAILDSLVTARHLSGNSAGLLVPILFWLLSVLDRRPVHSTNTLEGSFFAESGAIVFSELERVASENIARLICEIASSEPKLCCRICEVTAHSFQVGSALYRAGRVGLLYAGYLLLNGATRYSLSQVPPDSIEELRGEYNLFLLGESDPSVLQALRKLQNSEGA